MKKFSLFVSCIGLILFMMISGCFNDSDSDLATLNVRLVDAPLLLDNGETAEEVNVVIKRVDLVKKGSGEENADEIKSGDGIITVLETETTLNLLDYVDGVSALLGSVELEAGDYLQLRLVVDIEKSTIKFEGDETQYPLQIPSGGTSGIKIKGNAHNPLFTIEEGEEADLVFDFDAQMSIIVNQDKDKYKLNPVIKEVKFRNQVIDDFETE